MIQFLKNLWNKDWGGKFTIFGVLLIFFSGAGWTIYAVVTGEGDEGLMTYKGHVLKWYPPDIPVTCTYDPVTVLEKHLKLYDEARVNFNQKVGRILLLPCVAWMNEAGEFPQHILGGLTLRVSRPRQDLVNPVLGTTVNVESPFESHPGGITQHSFHNVTGKIFSVAIYIDPQAPQKLLPRIWAHEVGHALGLAHDRLSGSVMAISASGRDKKITERDVKTLQDTYSSVTP